MRTKQAPSVSIPDAGLRRFLYGTAAITGGVILMIEILGAKMLTPYFGASHFVWTAQIAVTLLALATGYYIGGWVADRWSRLPLVYAAILVAAIYLCGVVVVRTQLAYACLELNLALGSLVASLALFFVPLTLLATVGPFFVRMLTQSVQQVGRAVGQLSALSTVGSVGGVLLVSYVVIPRLRDSVALLGSATLLALVALVFFAVWGRGSGGVSLAVAGAVLGGLIGAGGLRRESLVGWQDYIEVGRANSHFGQLQVLESKDGRRRFYLNDFLLQNTYDVNERKSVSVFTDMLYELSRTYTPQLRRALCIGLGVGIVPMKLAADGIAVDVVEINPAVVPLARRFFGFDPAQVNLTIDDARHLLHVSRSRYDTIHLDAFLGDSSPSHLLTREAFEAMARLLEPDGTLVINAFADFTPGRDFFGTSLYRTLQSVFGSVVIHASPRGNVFYVASNQATLRVRVPPDLSRVHPSRRHDVEQTFATVVSVTPGRGQVLTDDFNPVEFHDAPNRERIRRDLALTMQSL